MEQITEQNKHKSEYNKEYYKNNRDYYRNYYIDNKDYYTEYSKEYYKNNKEYYRNYHSLYYIQNREHILQKQALWRQENAKMDTVYMFKDNNENTIYIGSSSKFNYRISSHCTSNSNLKMTAEEMVDKYALEKIIYKDFTQYELSRDDLFFLEFHLKESTNEILKTNKVHFDEEKFTRSKEELLGIMSKVEWKEFYNLEKYLD